MAEVMVKYFSEVGADTEQDSFDETHKYDVESFLKEYDWKEDGKDCTNAPFTEREISKFLRQLNKHKATGPDKVHNRFLIEGGECVTKALTELFNESWSRGYLPRSWKQALLR